MHTSNSHVLKVMNINKPDSFGLGRVQIGVVQTSGVYCNIQFNISDLYNIQHEKQVILKSWWDVIEKSQKSKMNQNEYQ